MKLKILFISSIALSFFNDFCYSKMIDVTVKEITHKITKSMIITKLFHHYVPANY